MPCFAGTLHLLTKFSIANGFAWLALLRLQQASGGGGGGGGLFALLASALRDGNSRKTIAKGATLDLPANTVYCTANGSISATADDAVKWHTDSKAYAYGGGFRGRPFAGQGSGAGWRSYWHRACRAAVASVSRQLRLVAVLASDCVLRMLQDGCALACCAASVAVMVSYGLQPLREPAAAAVNGAVSTSVVNGAVLTSIPSPPSGGALEALGLVFGLVVAALVTFDWLALRLRKCFTLAEGLIVAQGITALAYAFYLCLESNTLSWFCCDVLGSSSALCRPVAAQATIEGPTVTAAFVVILSMASLLPALAAYVSFRGLANVQQMQHQGAAAPCTKTRSSLHQHSGRAVGSVTCTRGSSPDPAFQKHHPAPRLPLRSPRAALETAAGAAALAPLCALVLLLAVWTLTRFLPGSRQRLGILAYWAALMVVALKGMYVLVRSRRVSQIIVRKGYHLLAVALFLPAYALDLPLLAVSLAIAFALLVACEVARCVGAPLLGPAIQEFMKDFTDSRDQGVVFVTHFTLLLGMAVPVWLAAGSQWGTAAGAPGIAACNGGGPLAAAWHGLPPRDSIGQQQQGFGTHVVACERSVAPLMIGMSGIVVLGLADTAAAIIGHSFGRLPVCRTSNKTLEGTVAGILFAMAGWWCILGSLGVAGSVGGYEWLALWISTASACALESVTEQLDNLVLPLFYLTHVCLLLPAR